MYNRPFVLFSSQWCSSKPHTTETRVTSKAMIAVQQYFVDCPFQSLSQDVLRDAQLFGAMSRKATSFSPLNIDIITHIFHFLTCIECSHQRLYLRGHANATHISYILCASRAVLGPYLLYPLTQDIDTIIV